MRRAGNEPALPISNHHPEWLRSMRMRHPFCILNVVGEVLDDGELRFVEAAQTLEAARRRIKALAELGPREYVIYNEQTGERVPITAANPKTNRRPRTYATRRKTVGPR